MLPNFICPGAQKSATTTLHDILKQHPDIYLPKFKETNFFSTDRYFKGLNWYEKEYYSEVKCQKIIGDISVGYLGDENAIKRISKDLGNGVKFIFIFRNPLDRAYSHFQMSKLRGFEKLSLMDAIKAEQVRLTNLKKTLKVFPVPWEFKYISNGLYARQLKKYLEVFPKQNMKFLIFEEFIKDRKRITKEIFEFLGVNSDVCINYELKSNTASKAKIRFINKFIYGPSNTKSLLKTITPKVFRTRLQRLIIKFNSVPHIGEGLTDAERQILIKLFIEDIKELEVIINEDLSGWYDLNGF